MKVPTYERQVMPEVVGNNTYANAPDAAYGVQTKAVDQSGLMNGIAGGLGVAAKFAEEKENLQVYKALNDLRSRGTEYLYNKNNGQLTTRLGDHADGIGGEVKTWGEQQQADVIKAYKLNARQQAAFGKAAGNLLSSWTEAAMKHESVQFEKSYTDTYNAMISGGIDTVRADPTNESLANELREQASAAMYGLAERQGWSDDVRKQKLLKLNSSFATARVSALLDSKDYAGADQFLKSHKDQFTAEDYARAEKPVRAEMELIQIQDIADRMAPRFGENSGAAAAWARQNFSGEMEQKVVSALTSRCSEARARRVHAEEDVARTQNKNYKALGQDLEAGKSFTPEQLNKLVSENKISENHAYMLMTKQNAKRSTASIANEVRSKYELDTGKSFYELPESQQEEMLVKAAYERRSVPYTPSLRAQHESDLFYGYINDEISDSYLQNQRDAGIISRRTYDDIVESKKKLGKEKSEILTTQSKDIDKTVKDLNKVGILGNYNALKINFRKKVAEIPVTDPKWSEKVEKAKDDTIADAIKEKNKLKTFWGIFNTNAGSTVKKLYEENLNTVLTSPDDIFAETETGKRAHASGATPSAKKEKANGEKDAARKKHIRDTVRGETK